MVSVIVKAALIVHFLHLIIKVASDSPCPTYFRYVFDRTKEEYSGVVEIPSPPKGVVLQLTVNLSIAAALPTQYVGRLDLAKSKEQSVKAVQQGRPLLYDLQFPLRWPRPSLTALTFNNKVICSGPPASGPVVTSIVLQHTLYPPGALPPAQNEDYPILNNLPTQSPYLPTQSPYLPVQLPYLPTQSPKLSTQSPKLSTQSPNLPTHQPPINYSPPKYDDPFKTRKPQIQRIQPQFGWPVNDDQCGKKEEVNPLIFSGKTTTPGQWPWLVAIYVTEIVYKFVCAGSLVTNSHVVTAAHCLLDRKISAGTLVVSLGRFQLFEFREKGSVNQEVLTYVIHPDFKLEGNADSDLAVIVLRERVEYTTKIKPICLWSGSTDVGNLVGKVGSVVGWGRDEKGNQNVQEPLLARIPVVPQDTCLRSSPAFSMFTSNRTFCAGAKDGSGPCNGDSGSGFVVYDRPSDRYYLRGVVSRSLVDKSTQSCDLNEYVIYVNVAIYTDWIMEQISKQ